MLKQNRIAHRRSKSLLLIFGMYKTKNPRFTKIIATHQHVTRWSSNSYLRHLSTDLIERKDISIFRQHVTLSVPLLYSDTSYTRGLRLTVRQVFFNPFTVEFNTRPTKLQFEVFGYTSHHTTSSKTFRENQTGNILRRVVVGTLFLISTNVHVNDFDIWHCL